MNILILEDEIYFQNKIIDIVKENISNAEITVYSTISNCLDDTMHFDLGIIDISLPDGDGIK